jgi:hypothetical protein
MGWIRDPEKLIPDPDQGAKKALDQDPQRCAGSRSVYNTYESATQVSAMNSWVFLL